jgi:foldase protein PrsA
MGIAAVSAVVAGSLWLSGCSGCSKEEEGVALFETAGQRITAIDVLDRMGPATQMEAYNTVLGQVLVEAEAEKAGITVDESLVDLIIQQEENLRGGAAAMDEALGAMGSDREEMREQIRASALTALLATQDVEVTDEEVREFYDQNSQAFGTPATYKYEMYMSSDRDKVETLVERVKAGENFLAVADELDPGTTAASETELQFVSTTDLYQRGDTLAPAVLENMEVGQVSQIQELPGMGDESFYRVFFLFDRTEADVPPFEQVEPLVRLTAKQQQPGAVQPSQLMSALILENEVTVLRDDLGLGMFEEQLNQYKTRQTAPPDAELGIPGGADGVTVPPAEDAPPVEGDAGQ